MTLRKPSTPCLSTCSSLGDIPWRNPASINVTCASFGVEAPTRSCRDSTYGLFVVNDGHNGAAAARYVVDTLSDYLQPLLPRGGPPSERRGAEFTAWRHAIQRALTVAMALLHRSFAAKGVLAGCTSTVVLQVCWCM